MLSFWLLRQLYMRNIKTPPQMRGGGVIISIPTSIFRKSIIDFNNVDKYHSEETLTMYGYVNTYENRANESLIQDNHLEKIYLLKDREFYFRDGGWHHLNPNQVTFRDNSYKNSTDTVPTFTYRGSYDWHYTYTNCFRPCFNVIL